MADSGTGRLVIRIGADVSDFKKAMADIQSGLKKALGKDSLNASKELLDGFKIAVVGAGALSLAAIKLGGDIQAVTAKYTYLFGSSKKAKEFVDDLESLALHSKFDFDSIDRAANQLTTLGFTAEKTKEILTTVADAATATGAGKDGIEAITGAFARMSQKATLSEREMKTLASAGIPAWDILSQKIGVSVPQAMQMAKDGTIKTSDAIKLLADGMKDKWGGAVKRLSGEVPASLERIKKTAHEMLQEFGVQLINDKDIKRALKGIADSFESLLDTLKKSGLKATIDKIFSPDVQEMIWAVAGALMGGMVGALIATSAAAAAVGVTLWPFYVVGAAIAALAFVVMRNWKPIWNFFQEMWIGMKYYAGVACSAIGDAFIFMAQSFLNSAEKMFGWIPGMSEKIGFAKEKIQDLKYKLDAIKEDNVDKMTESMKKLNTQTEKTTKAIGEIEPAVPGPGIVKPLEDGIASFEEAINKLKKGTENLGDSFSDSFAEIIMGTKTATEALKDLGAQMAKLFIKTGLQTMISAISGAVTGAGGATGGASTLGLGVDHLATGGYRTKPTLTMFAEDEPEFAVPLSQAGIFAKSVVGAQAGGNMSVQTNIINNAADKVQATSSVDKDSTGKIIQNIVIGMLANNTGGFKNMIKAATK